MRTPRWLVILSAIILTAGIILALPNFLTQKQLNKMPWLPSAGVTLGLDLQGGSYLVLEVDQNTMIRDYLRNVLTDARSAINLANLPVQSLQIQNNQIIVRPQNISQITAIKDALSKLSTPIRNNQLQTSFQSLDITSNDNTIFITPSKVEHTQLLSNAVSQSIEIIRQRVDQVGVAEPSIQKIGTNQIMVQLPGLQDPSQLRQLLGSTAKMTFHLLKPNASVDSIQPGVLIAEDEKNPNIKYPLDAQVALDGSHLTDARASFDPQTNQPIISFRLDTTGARIFAQITKKNIGQPFAIVLDNKVLTAPIIQSVISSGSGQISGNFTVQDTTTLSALLRAGSLPVPLTVIEERSVGPELGADSIKMGLYTGILGFILVALFIFLLYGVWGIIADIALLLHTILTFAALDLIGATLTLPGIAGIILGIGIAVDANILINERIKEETRKGASAFAALDRGFRSAFSTIVDANMTAIIATALLFWFGTGPVRGFAVTMFLGIAISMFTDVTMVRMMMHWFIRYKKYKILDIKPLISFKNFNPNFKFMNVSYWGILTSLLLSLISCILFIKPGLNYGIDFKGGIQIEVTNKQPIDLASLRKNLTNLNLGEVGLQNIDGSNSLMIRLQKQDGGDQAQLNALDKTKKVIHNLYPDIKFEKTEVVGPKVSNNLARNGLWAIILAGICMSLYIWWRFEWYFAVGAITTLILDVTKMVGFFVLFQIDFNLTAIAALLTIIGYSINDKVVVYDRMRENLRLYKKMPLRDLINMSINQVFIRCIFTSTTTFLAMLPMALFGGNAVYNFSVPMLAGIIIATTSSIFIAAPIMLMLGSKWGTRHKE